jgi:hypothetical protein
MRGRLRRREGLFISYRSADQSWAEWISWELEAAGYTVFVQAWDFRPGQNFVHQMQQGASSCRRTIAVLTPAYFESGFARAEWYSAFARDPTGEAGLLLPVRVQECDIEGLLGQVIYIDLVGLEKTQARERLLAGIEGTRAKPPQPPPFPDIFPGNRDIRVIPPLPPPSAEDRRGLLILLDRVKQFWIDGVLKQSVQHEALINLGKETKADAVEHPWEQVLELPDVAGKPLPADTRITDVFEDVGRLLLILGEPGSGKTMTLLELARDPVARARSGTSQPAPVVFNLSSWTEKFASLSAWLTEELKTKYLIPKRIGRSWLDGNRLLLLLDGLDEVQSDRRAVCIRAINAFLEDQGTTGLVVCSRLADTAEQVRLKMSGAICLRPLTATQIETYLSCLGSQLDALRAALNKDDVLRDLAKSPLMLSVMTLAYQGASVGALAGEAIETPENRCNEIFDTYIERMFARKGKGRGAYSNQQTKTSLSWLAQKMQQSGDTMFLVERMQPNWLDNTRQIFVYLFCSRFATAAAMWAAVGSMQILALPGQEVLEDLRSAFATDPRSAPLYLILGMLFCALLLTLFLGVACSCSLELFRYRIGTTTLSPENILLKTINYSLVVTHMLGWALVSSAAYISLMGLHFVVFGGYYLIALWTAFGLIFGLISCRRSASQDVRISDRLTWSWARPIRVSAVVFIIIASCILLIFLSRRFPIVRDTVESVLGRAAFFTLGVSIGVIGSLWPLLFLYAGLRTAAWWSNQLWDQIGSRERQPLRDWHICLCYAWLRLGFCLRFWR